MKNLKSDNENIVDVLEDFSVSWCYYVKRQVEFGQRIEDVVTPMNMNKFIRVFLKEE
jgi:hypothetical protein